MTSGLSLKFYLNSLVYHRNIFESSSEVSGNLRKSSDIFGNFRKCSGTFVWPSEQFENLRKSSESGRKSSENHQKRRHQYAYIIKRTLHVSSNEFYVLVARTISHSSLRSLVRYCFCHSNIKFISSRYRVISSISSTQEYSDFVKFGFVTAPS